LPDTVIDFTIQSRVFGFVQEAVDVAMTVTWKNIPIEDVAHCIARNGQMGDWVLGQTAQQVGDETSCTFRSEEGANGAWLYVALAKKVLTTATATSETFTSTSRTGTTRTTAATTVTSGTTREVVTITPGAPKETVPPDDIVNTGPEAPSVSDSPDNMEPIDKAVAAVLGVVVALILIFIVVFYKTSNHPDHEEAMRIGSQLRRSSKVGPADDAVAQAEMEEARIIEQLAAKGGFLLNSGGIESVWAEKIGNVGRRVNANAGHGTATAFLPSQHVQPSKQLSQHNGGTMPVATGQLPPLLPPLNPDHVSASGQWSLTAGGAHSLAQQHAERVPPPPAGGKPLPPAGGRPPTRERSARLSSASGSLPPPLGESSLAAPQRANSVLPPPPTARIPPPRTPSSISQTGPGSLPPLGELDFDDDTLAGIPRPGAPEELTSV
jgi:hypothetical protein